MNDLGTSPMVRLYRAVGHPEIDGSLSVERLRTTNMMLRSTFEMVPEELKSLIHQPTHCALDDLYLTTRTPPKIFLDPENYTRRFEKSFKTHLTLLQQANDPERFQAESL